MAGIAICKRLENIADEVQRSLSVFDTCPLYLQIIGGDRKGLDMQSRAMSATDHGMLHRRFASALRSITSWQAAVPFEHDE